MCILFLGIQTSPSQIPNPAINNNPIVESIGPRVVPTIAPIADQTTIIEIMRPRCILFSPSIAYSVTLSISGASFTVPSRFIRLGASPLLKISATSPIAISISCSTSTSGGSSEISSMGSVSIRKLPKSTPEPFWNLRLERISSSAFSSIQTSTPRYWLSISPLMDSHFNPLRGCFWGIRTAREKDVPRVAES